ncbi:MAG TPA: HDOD domain-containing protein [Opitutaceae bacterium]
MAPARDVLISLGSKLSPSMRVLGRLGERLRDPDASLEDIILLVRMDPSLTFKIMRLANGVMFGTRNRCDSLEDAVARVGVGEIHRIVGLAASHQAYQSDLVSYGFSAGMVWENSVAVAALAAALAKRSEVDPRSSYTAGLLRNVGRAVLDRLPSANRYPRDSTCLIDWERQNYGCSAPEVSALLLGHWRFPEPLVAMVENHVDPMAATGAHAPLSCLLNLACGLAVDLGAGLPGEDKAWAHRTDVSGVLGLDDVTIAICREEAQADIERTRAALGDLRVAA